MVNSSSVPRWWEQELESSTYCNYLRLLPWTAYCLPGSLWTALTDENVTFSTKTKKLWPGIAIGNLSMLYFAKEALQSLCHSLMHQADYRDDKSSPLARCQGRNAAFCLTSSLREPFQGLPAPELLCRDAPCHKDCMGGRETLPGTWWFLCSEGLSGKKPALPCAFGASYPSALEQEQALIPLAFWSSLLYFLAPLVYLGSDAALLSFALVCLQACPRCAMHWLL